MCGYTLGLGSVAYCLWVTVTLTSGLTCRKSCLWGHLSHCDTFLISDKSGELAACLNRSNSQTSVNNSQALSPTTPTTTPSTPDPNLTSTGKSANSLSSIMYTFCVSRTIGQLVECQTRDQEFVGLNHWAGSVLCP